MKNLVFILFICLVFSCKKQDDNSTPIPVNPTNPGGVTGCRIGSMFLSSRSGTGMVQIGFDLGYTHLYDAKGFIVSSTVNLDNRPLKPLAYTYNKEGLLVGISDNKTVEEVYEYTNGALSKIKIEQADTQGYDGYTINIETDDKKRITKMTDSKGIMSTLKRDSQGNIIEITKYDTNSNNKEFYKMIRSDFDGKKTPYELLKGWQFDHFQFYGDYITNPTFSVGAGGNPRKEQVYENGILIKDIQYTYNYSADGYVIGSEKNDSKNNVKDTWNFSLVGCK